MYVPTIQNNCTINYDPEINGEAICLYLMLVPKMTNGHCTDNEKKSFSFSNLEQASSKVIE
jgi:hypothetical protein